MIRFGVFADLHYDCIFDGDQRLDSIIESFKKEKLDFIISLGDLCNPTKQNRVLLDRIEQLGIPVYYVIGNHDADYVTQDEFRRFVKLNSLNYSFTMENTKFIVLNSCYMIKDQVTYPYEFHNYKKENCDVSLLIPEFEMKWLEDEMTDDEKYYVIFSHHSLANDYKGRAVWNRKEIQKLLSGRKTILCMNGHEHADDCRIIDKVPYYTLNACSYIWHGLKKVHAFSKEIHKKYPVLEDIILYKTAFHSVVEIDNGKVKIRGMKGEYMNLTPEDVGIKDRTWNGMSVEPIVSEFEN